MITLYQNAFDCTKQYCNWVVCVARKSREFIWRFFCSYQISLLRRFFFALALINKSICISNKECTRWFTLLRALIWNVIVSMIFLDKQFSDNFTFFFVPWWISNVLITCSRQLDALVEFIVLDYERLFLWRRESILQNQLESRDFKEWRKRKILQMRCINETFEFVRDKTFFEDDVCRRTEPFEASKNSQSNLCLWVIWESLRKNPFICVLYITFLLPNVTIWLTRTESNK